MSELQYVGARYVPKFAEPLEWDKSRSYEALTIVSYNYDNYTSKIPVPAGTEITNAKYWALTGQFNSQVAQYQKDVSNYKTDTDAKIDALNEDVTNYETEVASYKQLTDKNTAFRESLQNRKILFIGDSFSTGTGGGITTNGLAKETAICMGLDDSQYYIYAVSGYGFTRGEFNTLLTQALSEHPSEKFTDVVIVGGANDWNHTNDTISNIKAFEDAVSKIQNCKLWVAFCARSLDINVPCFKAWDCYLANFKTANLANFSFAPILSSEFAYSIAGHESDTLHLSDSGYKTTAPYVANFLRTGNALTYRDVRIRATGETFGATFLVHSECSRASIVVSTDGGLPAFVTDNNYQWNTVLDLDCPVAGTVQILDLALNFAQLKASDLNVLQYQISIQRPTSVRVSKIVARRLPDPSIAVQLNLRGAHIPPIIMWYY